MKIKKTTRYAIQAIGYIYNKGGEIVTSNVISKEEEIPHGVLMKVLRRLAEAEVVVSHQGRGRICGGFSLNIGLEQITLLKLMELMGEETSQELEGYEKGNRESQKIFSELFRIDYILKTEAQRYTLFDIIAEREKVVV